jgi:tetratricopeptide (TPR) repeat protein
MSKTFVALGLGSAVFVAGLLFLGLRSERRPPLLLVGIDGADWDILDPLIERGRLPNLARLKREGVSGPLTTLRDIPLSPVIWTSIATGKGPDEHGITWFLVDTPEGERMPVQSHNRKVQALWNILAVHGRAPGFVGWWATAPAEEVGEGVIASDALGFHGFGRAGQGLPDEEKVYPGVLHDELAALVPPVQQVDHALARRFFHLEADEYYRLSFSPARGARADSTNPIHLFQEYTATTLGYTAIARHLLAERALDLLAVYYESSDSMSHLFMKYAPPRQAWIEARDFERFQDVVDEYYVFLDEELGKLLADLPDDASVVVVSDHGFRIGAARPKSTETVDLRGAHLDHEPEGIFVASGPLFARGASVEGATVLDITPTLLHALDLPVARDMVGRVLGEVFAPGYVDEHPIRYVETFESEAAAARRAARASRSAPAGEPGEGDEALAALEALGYAGSEPTGATTTDGEEASSPEVLNGRGRLLLQKGELEAARKEFEAALRLSPDNPEALTQIGIVHLALGRSDAAIASFTQALRSNPNFVPALIEMAGLKKERGDLAGAESFYRQALAIDVRLPEPYNGLGDSLLRQGKVAEAKELFRQALELDPRFAMGHYNLGVALALLGEGEAAKAAYARALELAPDDPHVLNNLGDFALREGRMEEAEELFRRAAKVHPRHMESRFNVGAILLVRGEAAEALPWLEEAATLAPDHPEVQDRLAQAFLAKGDLAEARRRFEMQTRLFPASPTPCLALARLAKGEGKTDEASEWLRIAVQRGGEPVRQAIATDLTLRELGGGIPAPESASGGSAGG